MRPSTLQTKVLAVIDLLVDNFARIVFVAALVGTWFVLRTRATEFAPNSSLDQVIKSGKPVVLEFFRNT